MREEDSRVNEAYIQPQNLMMTWMIKLTEGQEGTEEEEEEEEEREADGVVSTIVLPLRDQKGGEEEEQEVAEGVVLIVTTKITEGRVLRLVDQEGTEKIVAGLGEEPEAEEAVLMMSLIERAAAEDVVLGVSGDLLTEEEEEETGVNRVMVKIQTLEISETVEELLRDRGM